MTLVAQRINGLILGLGLSALLVACGGGGDDPGPPAQVPAPLPAGTVGAAGGTVTGPSGSQVTIPAGALSQNTIIVITATSAGAPPLPANVTAIGGMLAFTPHGTAFANSATVTVPFDPALLPAGETPVLLKTNAARDGWETVAGAQVSGSALTGSVGSFSFYLPVLIYSNPQAEESPPHRIWEFVGHTSNDQEVRLDQGEAFSGAVDESIVFGPASIAPVGNDNEADGSIYSSENGFTYWVDAEAPAGNTAVPDDQIGAESRLYQRKFFRKSEADATLRFHVTQAWIEAIDNNGTGPVLAACPWANGEGDDDLCYDELLGEVRLLLLAVNFSAGTGGGQLLAAHQGIARLWGWQDHWRWSVSTDAVVNGTFSYHHTDEFQSVDVTPIFTAADFELTIQDGAATGTDAAMRLSHTVPVEIDLSHIEVGGLFMIDTYTSAWAHNRRGRESYVAARLRDPANATGLEWEYDGLTPVEDPAVALQIAGPADRACTAPVDASAGTVQFAAPEYSVPEFGDSSARVMITRTGGSTGTVIARVTSANGTAIAGQDFEAVAQTVVFHDGDTVPRAIALPIVNDTVILGARAFTLTLAPVGDCANLGTPAEAAITILDDESPPSQTFTVGGAVTGLVGSGLILQEVISGREDSAHNNAFIFDYQFPNGSAYEVRIRTQPTNPIQVCSIANAAGTVLDANVTNVSVSCETPAGGGSLDASFGAGGKVAAGLAGGAEKLAIQGDGKTVLLGDHGLARFNVDGSPDTSFGTGGSIDVNFTGVNQVARALAVQDDGRILVAGNGRPGANDDFAVARFNADGSVDTSFGTAGFVYVDIAGRVDQATGVLVQSSGHVVLTGHAGVSATAFDFAAVRLTTAGVLDNTFGTGGRATASNSNMDLSSASGLTHLDEIVIAGRAGIDGGASPDVGVARFSASGLPDTTFGGDGTVQIAYSAGNDEAMDLAIQSDRKVVIAGRASEAGNSNMLIARLNADGTRDTAFGTAGAASLDFTPGGDDFAKGVALQSDGSIVVAGLAPSTTVSDFALARFTSAGVLDTSFGTDGKLSVDFFAASDGANDLRVQGDGRIVVAGVARNGTSWGLGLARVVP